jgi:pyruvate ferredoxin oxidoreductase alpha subunit
VERFAQYVADGEVDTEIIPAESEHSVMSAAVGSVSAGVRTMTASSSAGLALMHEILGVASGLRLPVIMNVVNRALSSPINIHCDHSDSMNARGMGWIQIFSESAQEVYDHNLLAVKISEHSEVLLPSMVLQDGFLTSHLMERMEVLTDGEVKKYIGKCNYPYSLLKTKSSIGPLMLQDYFFETKINQLKAMEKAAEVYKESAKKLEELTGRKYPEVEKYKVDKDTDAVIVVTSSSAGTARLVAERLRKKGLKVGVAKIRLFVPFPYKELRNALKGIKNIAVLDRALSYGSIPPLYSEVRQAMCEKGMNIQSYVFGLGGRDLREKDIKEVFDDLLKGKYSKESKFLNVDK